jgi:D-hexose-6-phosphate mutarotase
MSKQGHSILLYRNEGQNDLLFLSLNENGQTEYGEGHQDILC